MQYVTKKQHRNRYTGFPKDNQNAYLNKWFLETNNLLDVDYSGMTEEEIGASLANIIPDAFNAMPFTFKWDLNLTGTELDIKFINVTEDNRIISHLSVDMSYLGDADACTLWYINDDVVDKSVPKDTMNVVNATKTTVVKTDLINSLAKSLPDRNFNILGYNSLVAFYVTKDNPTVDDIIVVIVRPVNSNDAEYNDILPEMQKNNIEIATGEADNTVIVTGNLTKHPKDPLLLMMFELMPEITVTSSTTSGDIITVNFTTDPNLNYIYLVQDSGYLPKTKIPVTNGTGSFKVVTTGMDPGDTVKVKMGFKYWVSRNDFVKTL